MKISEIPFNLQLLQLQAEALKVIKPVTSLDIYESQSSNNFNAQGLYSAEIFGAVGTQARNANYSYIDLRISVFQPVIYKALVKLKSLYADIMSGREFALFDEKLKDFVRSDSVTGYTGYEYFLQHWKKIVFEQRPSTTREENIALIEKNKNKAMTSLVYVIPALYRDLEISDDGRESSDEINSFYYKLIAIANTVHAKTVDMSPEVYNRQRYSLQMAYLDIYELLLSVIRGKKNMIMGKWASRRVFNGTRNVLTASVMPIKRLGDPQSLNFNQTQVGLFQFAKAILPLTRHLIKTKISETIFSNIDTPALLCDPTTLMSKRVKVGAREFNQWMTNEGLETLINIYREPSTRARAVMIGEHYAGLVYRGPDQSYKFIHGIDELPEDRDSKHCTPITMIEVLYLAMHARAVDIPGTVTRYPVATDRSIYPSMTYLRSTVAAEKRWPLDDEFNRTEPAALEFPILGSDTYNSLTPHPTRLRKLGADHDGDTGSFIALVTDEAVAECKEVMRKKMFYVGPDGKFVSDLNTATVDIVLRNMSFP